MRTVGNLVICVVNTFPGTTGGSGGSVPVLQAMAVAPRAVGWALGSDARLLRDKGVRSAQIATRGSGAVRIEVRGPSDSLASLASDLSEHLSGASRLECAP